MYKGSQKSRYSSGNPFKSDLFHPYNLLQFPREMNDSKVSSEMKAYDESLSGVKEGESNNRYMNFRYYKYFGSGKTHLPSPPCIQVQYYGQGLWQFMDFGYTNGIFMFIGLILAVGRDHIFGFGPPGDHGFWDDVNNMPGDMWIWPYDTPIGNIRNCKGTCTYKES